MKFQKKALAAQKVLASLGYYSGDLDGFWGKQSKKAYRKYQEKTGKTLKGFSKLSESLGERRRAFSLHFAMLVIYAAELRFAPQIEDVKAPRQCKTHMIGIGCAGDLSIFNPETGAYLFTTEAHAELGKYWESLSPKNRWGGRYSDGNHYERID